MNYKALYEKQKELYQHALRIPRSLGEWDAGMMTWKDKRFKLESEISALEQQISEEVSYPREFVEWFKYETIYWHCSIDGEIKYYEQEQGMLTNQIEYLTFHQIFEYWQSKVKNELTHNNQ